MPVWLVLFGQGAGARVAAAWPARPDAPPPPACLPRLLAAVLASNPALEKREGEGSEAKRSSGWRGRKRAAFIGSRQLLNGTGGRVRVALTVLGELRKLAVAAAAGSCCGWGFCLWGREQSGGGACFDGGGVRVCPLAPVFRDAGTALSLAGWAEPGSLDAPEGKLRTKAQRAAEESDNGEARQDFFSWGKRRNQKRQAGCEGNSGARQGEGGELASLGDEFRAL